MAPWPRSGRGRCAAVITLDVVRWTVVVPVKGLPAAKSRLHDATDSDDAHRRLTEAIRADTLAAAAAGTSVARVVIVTDDERLARQDGIAEVATHVVLQGRPGLNAALAEAADVAAACWPEDGVALLVGDLPALRPGDLDATLEAAAGTDRALVADADGAGTTLLTARPGVRLDPQFGPGSASRHAVTATALPAAAGLRRDVDTADDLRTAQGLGLGPATAAALELGVVTG
jgi:2-phospho-L-lactate/phosphoenolpyruvate guanylyltransferase